MSKIIKKFPSGDWVKMDKKAGRELSNLAFKLYFEYLAVPQNQNISDNYFSKIMGVSLKTLFKAKKELKDKNLLIIDKVGYNDYVYYVGHSACKASCVKEDYNDNSKI